MIRSLLVALTVLVAVPALAADPAPPAAKLSTSERFPVVGKATSVSTPPAADAIDVVYSPSSRVEEKARVPVEKLTPPRPNKPYLTPWIPDRAGVAQLSAGGQSIKVSVRFDGVPTGGIVIMLIAGVILFGGAFVSMKSLLSGDG